MITENERQRIREHGNARDKCLLDALEAAEADRRELLRDLHDACNAHQVTIGELELAKAECARLEEHLASNWKSIRAERDAAVAAGEEMRAKLCEYAIRPCGDLAMGNDAPIECGICEGEWDPGHPESHTPNCLLSSPANERGREIVEKARKCAQAEETLAATQASDYDSYEAGTRDGKAELKAENARLLATLGRQRMEIDGLRKAGESLITAWGNRGEKTSLHVWNERMKAAITDLKATLAAEPKPGAKESPSEWAKKVAAMDVSDFGAEPKPPPTK